MVAGATWIEAALNGPWGRNQQPGIPITVEEIVADGLAAAAAGAAILHLHAYDAATGCQRDDWEIYARIIEGIRARSDALVYPTIPLADSAYADKAGGPGARFAHAEELARRGLIEIAVGPWLRELPALRRGRAARHRLRLSQRAGRGAGGAAGLRAPPRPARLRDL